MIVIVPSRGRPENIAELQHAVQVTAAEPDGVQIVTAVDTDDPRLDEYRAVAKNLVVGGPQRLGPWLNQLAPSYAAQTSVIGFMGDDHRCRSSDWDREIEQVLSRTGIAYGNDLIQGPNLPTAVFISSPIIQRLGYMVPPGITHMFADNAWAALGKAIDRFWYLPDVVIEHCHPIAEKSEWDDTYRATNNGAVMAADEKVFDAWRTNDLPGAVEKLREVL